MKKLVIKKIDNFDYVLTDGKRDYNKNIEFVDIKLEINDIIYMLEDMLKEDNMFTFGPLVKDAKVNDTIKIIHNGKEMFMSRYYG